jgi:hypothetical protein
VSPGLVETFETRPWAEVTQTPSYLEARIG